MPAPLNVDREAVRVLAVAVGVREAARQMGLSEDTVAAWSAREKWGEKIQAVREIAANRVREREEARGIVQATASKSPAEAMADALETLSTRSKVGFAKASAKVAEKLAESDPDELITLSSEAQSWAKTAALAGGWSNGSGTTVQVSVGLRLEMD